MVSGVLTYYTWNGSAFTGVSTGLAYDSTSLGYYLADINGDGLPDILTMYETLDMAHFDITVKARLNTSAGSTLSFSSTNTVAFSYPLTQGAQLMTPDARYGILRRFGFQWRRSR